MSDSTEEKKLKEWTEHCGSVLALCVFDGERLCSGGSDNRIFVYDLNLFTVLQSI